MKNTIAIPTTIPLPSIWEQIRPKTDKKSVTRIKEIKGEIPIDLDIKRSERYLFISKDQTKFTHGIHKYPAKFFPELPRWLIKKYSKEGDWVLDPFTGSGTLNLECLLNRRHSAGVDVDPFARFVAKVKTTPLSIQTLKETALYLVENIRPDRFYRIDKSKLYIPNFPYKEGWFRNHILLELAFIKKHIENLRYEFRTYLRDDIDKIINFYLVCFASIIRSVSNADNNCTRTVVRKSLNKKIYKNMAIEKFLRAIADKVPKMIEFLEKCPRDIRVEIPENDDARNLHYKNNFFDLAVTSPPYANAVDYPRTHQLEMYWLGIASGSLNTLKKQHVGTEAVSSKEYCDLHLTGYTLADKKIRKIFKKDERRAFILYKYLMDMKQNLQEVNRVIKPDSVYAIVVGNNQIRGEEVESWRYFIATANDTGYSVENYFGSEIINHFIKVPRKERINTDWVLILKKK